MVSLGGENGREKNTYTGQSNGMMGNTRYESKHPITQPCYISLQMYHPTSRMQKVKANKVQGPR
jgi:hypothetical protein